MKTIPQFVIDALNLDANEAIFFSRQLEHVKATVYEQEYPALMAKQMIPVSTEAGPDVKAITYRTFDKVGMAAIISNPADDLPKVGLSAQEHTASVRGIGAAYEYSRQDLRYAQRNGIQLDSRLAMVARESIELKEDQIGWFGDQDHNLQGMLTNPNVSRFVVDAGASTTTDWADKTADEIIADVTQLVRTIKTATLNIEKPDTIAIAPAGWIEIATRPRSSTSDTTILEFLRKVFPGITFEEVDIFDDIENSVLGRPIVGGGDTSNIMVAYTKRPDRLSFEICQPFEQLPPEARNLALVVNCTSRTGGVIIYKPLSICIAEGI